jgi:hypothetical protein
MEHTLKITTVANRLLDVLNEFSVDDVSALAALDIAKILFVNQHDLALIDAIEQKFGLRLVR